MVKSNGLLHTQMHVQNGQHSEISRDNTHHQEHDELLTQLFAKRFLSVFDVLMLNDFKICKNKQINRF